MGKYNSGGNSKCCICGKAERSHKSADFVVCDLTAEAVSELESFLNTSNGIGRRSSRLNLWLARHFLAPSLRDTLNCIGLHAFLKFACSKQAIERRAAGNSRNLYSPGVIKDVNSGKSRLKE